MSEVDTYGLPLPIYELAKNIYEIDADHNTKKWDDLDMLEKLSQMDVVVDVYNGLIIQKDDDHHTIEYVKTLWEKRNISKTTEQLNDIIKKVKNIIKEQK
jgi:hypothetical protein